MITTKRIIALERKIEIATKNILDHKEWPTKTELKDFTTFIKFFYKQRTDREYTISCPHGREPHQITLSKFVPRLISHEINRLMINIPPRYGKTEFVIHLIAYCVAHYPGSNYLYISYSKEIAVMQTAIIRKIISLASYENIFGITLDPTSKSKENFQTNTGCRIVGAGAGGPITGKGAGIRFSDNFGGLAVLDDMHKPIEITHENHRSVMKDWHKTTFLSRLNNPRKTPVIAIGQILHEDDNCMNLRAIGRVENLEDPIDTEKWELCILKGLDDAGNALDPTMHTAEKHEEMRKKMPYMWYSQHQQTPQPAGGSLYQVSDFQILDSMPNILGTFIVCDAADTEKTFNDATALSFFGLYKIKNGDVETDEYALHWLDCWEFWVEPKDLQGKVDQFYHQSLMFYVKPCLIGIEKKAAGTSLLSAISSYQGIRIIDTVDYRENKRASKIDRFIDSQRFVSNKQITFPNSMKHARLCIDHLAKITANNTHLRDDIADTMTDAINIALKSSFILSLINKNQVEQHAPISLRVKPISF